MRIVTDPYFSTGGNMAYKRVRPPALSREELCNADLVLVSHPHFDHVDGAFLRMLPAETPVVTSAVGSAALRIMGCKNITAARPWQRLRFDPVAVNVVPASHFGMTVGFVIEAEGKQVYFAGDTFYGAFMGKIGERFKLALAMMPVATFLIPMTMGNGGAVKAADKLGAAAILPIHEALQQGARRRKETVETFKTRLKESGSKARVVVLKEGASTVI